MFQRLFSLCFLFTFVAGVIAQTDKADSIKAALQDKTGDERLELLHELAMEQLLFAPKDAMVTAWQAVDEAEKKGVKETMAQAYSTVAVIFHKRNIYDSALVFYNKAVFLQTDNEKVATSLNNIGVIYKELSNYDSAIVFHKRALKLEEMHGRERGNAAALNLIANVYLKQGKYDSALEYYTRSLRIRKKNDLTDDIAASYNNIGNVHKRMNDYDKALNYLQMSLYLRDSVGDKPKTAITLNSIGNFFLQLDSYDKAREYYERSLQLRIEENDLTGIGNSYNNIATVHRELGNYDKALEYYEKAITYQEQSGNKSAVAYTKNNIGGLYMKKGDYALSIKYLKQALELRKEIGNKNEIARSMRNLGINYKKQKDYSSALTWYNEALQIYIELGDLQGLADIQNLDGNLYKTINELKAAEEHYKNSLSIYEQLQNKQGIADLNHNLGELYLEKSELDKAEKHLLSTLENAQEIKRKDLLVKANFDLYELYKKKGNPDKGLDYFVIHTQWKDSINTHESKKKIAEIEFANALRLKDALLKDKDLKLVESTEELRQQRIYFWIAGLIALIILIFSILLYMQMKQKHRANLKLEEKKKELEEANGKLEQAKANLEKANQDVTDSINYAKRIQDALLPSKELINHHFPKNFIIFSPKDIVSGDFYWFADKGAYKYIAAVDCTGHGVPGAFMSMIGSSLLNEIVHTKNVTDPEEILHLLNKGVISALNQSDEQGQRNDDGMELTLCRIDEDKNELVVGLANHKMVIVRKGQEPELVNGSYFPIGGLFSIKKEPHYKQFTFPIEEGMRIYMFSDGYCDQFGGEEKLKYMTSQFLDKLKENQKFDIYEQSGEFENSFDDWKGNLDQVDDVMLIGIEF